MSVKISHTVTSRSSSGGAGSLAAGGGGSGAGLGLSSGMAGLSLSSYGGGSAGGSFGMAGGSAGGFGSGGGYGLGSGLGGGYGLGSGLGGGYGLSGGYGASSGFAGGYGGGSGFGGGFGGGMGAGGLSPAFAMGRTLMAGGLSQGSAQGFASMLPRHGASFPSSASLKQTLAGLNDRFHSYVEKVKQLQLENKTLQAQLDHLTGGAPFSSGPGGDSSTPVNYEAQLTDLRTSVENLTLENIRHEIELDNIRGAAEELKAKHDFELGVKFQLETDIATMKRDIEVASEIRTDLEQRYTAALDELDYVKKTHGEEVSALQTQLGTTSDKSVSLIEVDAVRSFDITKALKEMRANYEQSVQQHREDAQRFYEAKMSEIHSESAKNSEEVAVVKGEITAAKKDIQGLSMELHGLLSMNSVLENNLAEASAMASIGMAESQAQIASYEAAIESGKVELHKVIMNYQELLDIKQALDVEIATYRNLLEGEHLKFPELETLTGGRYTFSSEHGFEKKHGSSSEFGFEKKHGSSAEFGFEKKHGSSVLLEDH